MIGPVGVWACVFFFSFHFFLTHTHTQILVMWMLPDCVSSVFHNFCAHAHIYAPNVLVQHSNPSGNLLCHFFSINMYLNILVLCQPNDEETKKTAAIYYVLSSWKKIDSLIFGLYVTQSNVFIGNASIHSVHRQTDRHCNALHYNCKWLTNAPANLVYMCKNPFNWCSVRKRPGKHRHHPIANGK